jgi:hypothetical protein
MGVMKSNALDARLAKTAEIEKANTYYIDRMTQEQLEEFIAADLKQIGRDIYATVDGKFSVKHVSFVVVEGINDPKKTWFGDEPWKPGKRVEITEAKHTDSDGARRWLSASYALYQFAEMWNQTLGRQPRKDTVERRRLERMEAFRQ